MKGKQLRTQGGPGGKMANLIGEETFGEPVSDCQHPLGRFRMITPAGIVLEEIGSSNNGDNRLVFHFIVRGSTAAEREIYVPISNSANLTVFFDKNEVYLFTLLLFMAYRDPYDLFSRDQPISASPLFRTDPLWAADRARDSQLITRYRKTSAL